MLLLHLGDLLGVLLVDLLELRQHALAALAQGFLITDQLFQTPEEERKNT